MTREEAMRLLDPETNIKAIEAYEGMESYAIDEACKVAISALRAKQTPLDRSRWEGCDECRNTVIGRKMVGVGRRYCHYCGRPLTEEAEAALKKRGAEDGHLL